MKKQITFATDGDSYIGIYVDGVLIDQGTHIVSSVTLTLLSKALDCDFKCVLTSEDYFDNHLYFPELLSELDIEEEL